MYNKSKMNVAETERKTKAMTKTNQNTNVSAAKMEDARKKLEAIIFGEDDSLTKNEDAVFVNTFNQILSLLTKYMTKEEILEVQNSPEKFKEFYSKSAKAAIKAINDYGLDKNYTKAAKFNAICKFYKDKFVDKKAVTVMLQKEKSLDEFLDMVNTATERCMAA